jgi:hypothetical protein
LISTFRTLCFEQRLSCWIDFPDKRFGFVGIVLLDEAIDCGLQIDKRVEYAMLEPVSGQFGKVIHVNI